LVYNGQEVGEPAVGAEGFGGDDARTSIFDYWSMPELAKWVNAHRYDGGRLSAEQRELREYYARLLKLTDEAAFLAGEFLPLNRANRGNSRFGQLTGEPAGGHWIYAYLRKDRSSGQCFLVVANLHGRQVLRDVRVHLPPEGLAAVHAATGDRELEFRDRLGPSQSAAFSTAGSKVRENGLELPPLAPLTAYWFEVLTR
jgi:hypothetical protein